MPDPVLYTPLSEYLSAELWPSDLFAPSDGSFLDRIAYEEGTIVAEEGTLSAELALRVMDELSFQLPLGFAFVLGAGPVVASASTGEDGFHASVFTEVLKLRLPRSLFKPVVEQDGKPVADPNPDHFVDIPLPLGVSIDGDFNIDIEWPGESPGELSLPRCMVGDSGVIISAENILLRLSSNQELPDTAAALGLDTDWHGLFVGEATVELPEGLGSAVPSDIKFSNAFIGDGGFSGEIAADWTPAFAGEIFGVTFGLKRLGLTFVQNSLESSEIVGTITLPYFDEDVDVEIGLNLDGTFTAALRSEDGLVTLTKPNILRLDLESLGFAFTGGTFTATLSGHVTPLFGGLDWPAFQVKELSIDSDGNVRFDGGWMDLREQYSLDFHGFTLEITKLGFGKTDDGTGKWIGFSGGLNLVDGLSAGASVEGLRLSWYDSGDIGVSLNGVGVELDIPGVLRFKGEVSYRELPGDIHRFDGDITLDLVTLDMRIDAQLVIGTAGTGPDRHTFMAIHLGLELPAGIPLGATGLALYGMAGLFALEMEPDKLPDEAWYENDDASAGWYRRPTEGVSDLSTKWRPARGSLALGAGVTLGTLSDNGYTFSGKLLLVIAFPGPVLLIEGRANLLKERAKLDGDATFRALAVLDGREGTFLLNVAAQYKHGNNAELIDIRANAEAFFDFSDADAWHLYLGEKEPRERRIRAEIFRLFEANSYVMLDARQLAMGAWLGYDKNWKFGPLRVTVEAWIEGNVVVSWKPVHLHGDLWLHGKASVKAFGFGLTLGVDAQFAADVFDPFHLLADFTVKIGLPWPLSDIKKTIELEWGPQGTVPALPMPLKEIAVEHFKTTTSWPLPRAGLLRPDWDPDGDGFVNEGAVTASDVTALEAAPPPEGTPVVPLDCRPHLTFGRAVHDRPLVGTNVNFVVPPRERIGDPANNEGPLEVEYSLRRIELHKLAGGTWSLIARRSDSDAAVGDLYGSWAPVAGAGTDGIAQVKLWLWSKSAFDYTRHSGGAWNEWFTDQFGTYPCVPPPPDRVICCDFESVAADQVLRPPYHCPDHDKLTISWSYPPETTVTVLEPSFRTFGHALCVPAVMAAGNDASKPNSVLISPPEPAKSVRILVVERDDGSGGAAAADAKSPVTGTGYTTDGQVIGPVAPVGDVIDIQGPGLVRVVVTGQVCVVEVCVNLGPDPAQVELGQEMAQHLRDETARWSRQGDVLEPHTDYRLTVVTHVSASGIASQDIDVTEFAYFRTEGPPGLAALSTPAGQDAATFDSGLDDLARYVARTVPSTVPAAGEQPSLPRPVYRAYDVGVAFNENYVDLMYRMAGRDLGLYLYDHNNRPVRDVRGRLIVAGNRWGVTEDLTLTESENYWVTTVNGSDCAVLDTTLIPHHSTLGAADAGQVLDGDTVYEARLVPLPLHEAFTAHQVGDTASGTAATLRRWTVADEGTNGAPSHWEVREEGTPASRYVVQTSNIWGGTTAANDAVKPGTFLVYADAPLLAPGHPEQPSNWTDYRVSVYLRSADDDAIGIAVRYAGPTRHYRFVMDRERAYRRLLKVYDGVTTVLAGDEFTYALDRDYQVTVEAVGASLRIYQDGELVFDRADESLRAGTIGLYCWANTAARFSDVRVDDFSPAASPVYRFQFTTSRFANFVHHVHSYRDETWRAVTADSGAVAAAVAAAVEPTAPASPDEARAYEQITDLAGLATQPPPPEIQVTRLELAEPFALLVRGPEPIEWGRTALELRRATRSGAPIVAPRTAKLIDVAFATTDPNEESVTLLLPEPAGLDGLRIDYQTFPGVLTSPGAGNVLFTDEFAATAGLLFHEDFGPNALDHYTIVDEGTSSGPSAWSVVAGAIVQTSNIYGGSTAGPAPDKPGTSAIVKAPQEWTNVRIRVAFSSVDDDAIGVVFRFADRDNYYRLSLDSERGYRRLVKKIGGVVTVLWEDAGGFDIGQSYDLTIDAFGDHLVGHLAGVPLFNVRDADRAAGTVGFYCWANVLARFEALQVESLDADPVLWEPAFTNLDQVEIVDSDDAVAGPSWWEATGGTLRQTSDINAPADGVHFPGTYVAGGDPQWRDARIYVALRSDDDDAIGVLFRYVDDDNYYRFSMDSERSYRRLIKKVAGAVSTLWQDSVAYTVGQRYDLSIRAAGTELSAHLNGTPLFTVHDDALRAGRIGFYCWSNTGAHFEGVLVTDAARRIGEWTVTDEGAASGPSEWALGGGALVQRSAIGDTTSPDYPGTFVVGPGPSWTDLRLAVTVRADAGGAIGVIFRHTDDDNYYRLSLDHQHNQRRLVRKQAGTTTILFEEVGSYAVGAQTVLTIDAAGSRLVGYIGAERLFDVVDSAHPGGRVGLYCWQNPGARFERVEVRTPPIEAYALMTDRFAEGDTGDWTFVDEGTMGGPSVWSTLDGALRQTSDIFEPPIDRDTLSKRGTHAVAGDPAWTDIVVSTRLRSVDDDAIGILFRYADDANFYRFSMDSQRGYRRLVKAAAGEFTVLWEDDVAYEVGQSYEITLALTGATLRGYLDGIPLFVVEDPDVPAGRIGLYCWGNADARFSRVRVYPARMAFDEWLLDEPFLALAPGAWTFVDDGTVDGPSDWQVSAGWLRQTGSIHDGNPSAAAPAKSGTFALADAQSWTDYRLSVRLASGEDDAIGVMFRCSDVDNYYRLSMDSQRGYRRLIKKVGGAVSVLWEDDVAYQVGREYLTTVECVGTRLSGYVDGVRLFALDDPDLAAGGIALYCCGNVDARFAEVRVAPRAWETYYAFAGEDLLPAGTRVQVLSGNAAQAPWDAEQAGLARRFAATLADRGTIRLPATGTALRVVAGRDDVVHARSFRPGADYQSIDEVRVLRKADGTAFVVLVPSTTAPGSLLEPADYRIRMAYRRNNQILDPGSVVLSQAGVTADEVVTLDVPWSSH